MDDLSSKISQVLSNPESLKQLQAVAASLGLDTGGGSSPSSNSSPSNSGQSGLDTSGLAAMLSGFSGGQNQPSQETTANNPFGNIDMGMLMNLQKAFSALNTSDKNVELLQALKPHFHSERAKRVDDAIRIMQLISMLPMLKESGLFGGDLFR